MSEPRPVIAVVTFPGSNDDRDAALALERLGAEPADAAYVGDSPFDVQAARAAGVFSVGVAWGGIHSRERLAAEEPDALVDSAEELRDRL